MSQATEAELRGLLRDLSQAPRAIQTGTRRVMRQVGSDVLDAAKSNAGWSTQIPAAMGMRVTLAGDGPGVELRVNTKAARHGRVMEGFSGLVFRHPVFAREGRPQVWVPQTARPYLTPAVAQGADQFRREAAEAASEALSRHNL